MESDPVFKNQYYIIVCTITIIKNILLCTAIIINKNLVTPKDDHTLPSNLNLDSLEPFNN